MTPSLTLQYLYRVNLTPIDDLLAAYYRDGGVIISGLLTLDQVARFDAEISSALSKTNTGNESSSENMKTFHGSNTKRLTYMTSISETFRKDILDHDLVHELTQKTLSKGLNIANYWLNSSQIIEIGPGNPAQVLHRDCFYPLIPRYRDSPEVINNFLIALTEYKEGYGATRVIPGSHLWEDFDDLGSIAQTVPAEMEAGDALWICGNVVHGGGGWCKCLEGLPSSGFID
ncbi:Protein involved in biosynthesis of mitomycin antibiotics or polyketide fumonisin [Penicillium brasilianum]|uniref:Protein involved in biosynthesis of mitomycin antibiotics or polyketide fumonisin n=1 Tax=Penicillium brasilianum TaxID=104259 RepID=A0A1S9RW03_PENBI|nr:Protein involved in biosynthesis of mitomycin antibiotics or polyketide fumonisin [Penicillium brasilianum]